MALISVAFLSSSQATLLNFLEKSIPNSIIPAIMLGTICIGIINVWYITEQVILPDAMANYHSLFLTTNILSTIISIAIGWLFQSVLVYLLAVSLGSQSSFRFYCSAVGVAYSGLFLAAICHLVYTFFTLDTAINLQDLQSFLALSRERNSISRFGEFSMLVALSYLILRYEKLDTISKLTIAFVPTILLGVLSAFLKSAFNVSI
jgi:predicted lysophospholipase L1 biosynthesis ABC-type transport system permease subunit